MNRLRTILANLTAQATILIGLATGIQGTLLILSLYWGFQTGRFEPFYTVIAGTGWYAFVVKTVSGMSA